MSLQRAFCIALCVAALGCETSPMSPLDGRQVGLDIGFIDQATRDAGPADFGPSDARPDGDGPIPDDMMKSDLRIDQPAVPRDSSVDRPAVPRDSSVDQPAMPADSSVDSTADSAISLPACSNLLDPATVALYAFEGGWGAKRAIDETGDHHGSLVDSAGKTSGPTDCGSAVGLPATSYVTLPASSAWDLAVGSISFWVRFGSAASGVAQGILSRDASVNKSSTQAGHFTMNRDASQGLVNVRLQDVAENDYYFCSDAPVPVDTWTEIAVNFGPPRVALFINGVRATRSDTITIDNGTPKTVTCNPVYTGGIDGNNEPWLLGASASSSEENSVLPLKNPMTDGAIDQLRISSMRRDFTR